MAAQIHALITNDIKVKIDKQEGDVRCGMCNDWLQQAGTTGV